MAELSSVVAGIYLNATLSGTSTILRDLLPSSVSEISALSRTSLSAKCDQCFVTAGKAFYSYPYALETEFITATNTIVPLVTVHPGGQQETNYVTKMPQSPTANGNPSAADLAALTWEGVPGYIMTNPTTYVRFFGIHGGTFYPTTTADSSKCALNDQFLQLPANYANRLIVPIPEGPTTGRGTTAAIPLPPAINDYLNDIPAVRSQFGGTNLASCTWSVLGLGSVIGAAFTSPAPQPQINPQPQNPPPAQNPPNQASPTPVHKTTVVTVVGVTAQPVSITAPMPSEGLSVQNQINLPQNQIAQGQPLPLTEYAGISSTRADKVDPVYLESLKPIPGPTEGAATQNVAAGGINSGNTPAVGQSGHTTIIVLGGITTTITSQIVPHQGTTGSATAFVIGSSILVVGGTPFTVSGSVQSASTGGANGGATPTIVDFEGPANTVRGPSLSLWVVATMASIVGALAVGL